MRNYGLRTVSLVALAIFVTLPAVAAESGYKLVKTIDLPGDKGGHGDYVVFDADTSSIWIAQSPDHQVVVVDTTTNTVKGVIPGIANGNLIVTTPKYAFLNDADSTTVTVVDKRTLKPVGTFLVQGKTPDGMVYDPKTDQVYVTADETNDVTVVNAAPPFAPVAHFALQPDKPKDGPDVGTLAVGRIYQPVDNVVDIIDPVANKVTSVWKPNVKGDVKPMVYDPKSKHLFAGTTDKKMLVLNASDGAQFASIPLMGSVDQISIDLARRRAFVGDKAGMVEVVDLDSNTIVNTIPSEKNMHTLAVDTKTHNVYVYRNQSNKMDVFSPPPS